MEKQDTAGDEQKWVHVAANVSVIWKALWPVLCGIAAVSLGIFEAISSFNGHPIDPQVIVMIGGFAGLPLFGGHS